MGPTKSQDIFLTLIRPRFEWEIKINSVNKIQLFSVEILEHSIICEHKNDKMREKRN